MDIDLTSKANLHWQQDECPWNKDEKTHEHKCAIKNISICDHFKGIEPLDIVICDYKVKN